MGAERAAKSEMYSKQNSKNHKLMLNTFSTLQAVMLVSTVTYLLSARTRKSVLVVKTHVLFFH